MRQLFVLGTGDIVVVAVAFLFLEKSQHTPLAR